MKTTLPTLRVSKQLLIQFVPHCKKWFVWKKDKRLNNTYIKFIWLGIIYKHK